MKKIGEYDDKYNYYFKYLNYDPTKNLITIKIPIKNQNIKTKK